MSTFLHIYKEDSDKLVQCVHLPVKFHLDNQLQPIFLFICLHVYSPLLLPIYQISLYKTTLSIDLSTYLPILLNTTKGLIIIHTYLITYLSIDRPIDISPNLLTNLHSKHLSANKSRGPNNQTSIERPRDQTDSNCSIKP